MPIKREQARHRSNPKQVKPDAVPRAREGDVADVSISRNIRRCPAQPSSVQLCRWSHHLDVSCARVAVRLFSCAATAIVASATGPQIAQPSPAKPCSNRLHNATNAAVPVALIMHSNLAIPCVVPGWWCQGLCPHRLKRAPIPAHRAGCSRHPHPGCATPSAHGQSFH